jgi:hypothetical protein
MLKAQSGKEQHPYSKQKSSSANSQSPPYLSARRPVDRTKKKSIESINNDLELDSLPRLSRSLQQVPERKSFWIGSMENPHLQYVP